MFFQSYINPNLNPVQCMRIFAGFARKQDITCLCCFLVIMCTLSENILI